jgi:TatD DNase family protein
MNSGSARPDLVDVHCHVDLFPVPFEFAKSIQQERVHTIAVTNAPSVFEHTERLASGNPYLHPAVGLHPELVATHEHELEAMWPFLDRTRFVGEIGLDYGTADPSVRARQRAVFSKILDRCARQTGKVITVHSRRAAADVVAAIGDKFPGCVILHWFSGSIRELHRATQGGLYFSVNAAMIESANGRRLIAEMPRERVLTESDGPFVRGSHGPASIQDCNAVLRALAACWNVDAAEAANSVLLNYSRLVGDQANNSKVFR